MEMLDSVRIKMLLPYIAASDVLFLGQDGSAAGLHYDDGNMMAPIVMLLEKGIEAGAFTEAASGAGVPVIRNESLVKNLFTYGKVGDAIPDLCCREVAAVIARNGKRPPSYFAGRDGAKARAKLPRPVKIELGPVLMTFLEDGALLLDGLSRIQKRLSLLLGIRFPTIPISANRRLKAGEYRILFKGIEAGRGNIDLGWYKTVDFGLDAAGMRPAERAVTSVLISRLDELVQKRAPDLLGRDEVQAILDRAEKKYPVVTGEVKSLLSLGSIRDIFRGLVDEQVSIRHIPVILETLADWGGFGPAPNEIIIEQIRQSLKRQICMAYADDKQTLRVLTLDIKLEQNFSERAIMDNSSSASSVSPDEWLDAFSPAIRGMEEKGLKPVLLCSPITRSWIKEFTRMKFPHLAVLSYIEIPSDIKVETVGEVALKRRPGS